MIPAREALKGNTGILIGPVFLFFFVRHRF